MVSCLGGRVGRDWEAVEEDWREEMGCSMSLVVLSKAAIAVHS